MSEFLTTFQAELDAPALPDRISGSYRLDSALGHSPESGAFLLRRREDGAPFVLRISAGNQDLEGEARLLGRLRAGLAPEPVDYFEEDGVQYLIRTYIPGRSLAEMWEPDGGIERWAGLGTRLCDLLAELHSLEPPVVHRDVKPENIILSPDGTPYLIDFGIARSIKPEQTADTVHMGTRATAAPEQYGFAQSDQRTDLYALGVTLRWMVTGSYRPDALNDADCPGWVKRFLRKAAAFDPKDRYPSASAMAEALRRHAPAGRRRRKALTLAACLAVLLLALLGAAGGQRPVDFGSPLLEAAVRAELDKPEGDITRADLEQVRRLAVVGQELLREEQNFFCQMSIHIDGECLTGPPRGDISDLSLLVEMPNLTTLYLCCQYIADLTPLEGLPLRELYLHDNNIQDLSPLKQLPDLQVLYIGGNPAKDLSPLSSLTRLQELNLDGRNRPESFLPLAELPLESLSLNGLEPQDGNWSVLGELGKLELLRLWGTSPAAVAALGECFGLQDLILYEYRAEDLRSLPVMPNLGALSLAMPLPSYEGIQRQPQLHYLALQYQGKIDLSPIAEIENLSELGLNGDMALDFRPLAEIGALRQVNVRSEEIAAAIAAECPERGFEIVLE